MSEGENALLSIIVNILMKKGYMMVLVLLEDARSAKHSKLSFDTIRTLDWFLGETKAHIPATVLSRCFKEISLLVKRRSNSCQVVRE